MASSEQQCLRFFTMACCFSLLIGVIGCATNNWSEPLFDQGTQGSGSKQSIGSFIDQPRDEPPMTLKQKWDGFWNAGFGSSAGLDPQARAIEKSLGL